MESGERREEREEGEEREEKREVERERATERSCSRCAPWPFMIVSQCRQGIHIVVDAIFSQPVPVAASSAAEVLRLHRSSTRRQETYPQPVAPEAERARGEEGREGRQEFAGRLVAPRRTCLRSPNCATASPRLPHHRRGLTCDPSRPEAPSSP